MDFIWEPILLCGRGTAFGSHRVESAQKFAGASMHVKGTSFTDTRDRRLRTPSTGGSWATAMEKVDPLEGPPRFEAVLCEIGTTLAVLLSIAMCVTVVFDMAPPG
jgi:hypothetical protein